jgi:iron(III) transport system substrate-binding protein
MKALVKLMTLVMLLGLIIGCSDDKEEATQVPDVKEPATAEPAVVELSKAEQWAKDNGLGPYTPDVEDWAAIEAAALKEGKVVVYSNSSKIEKLIEPFQEKYPGIVLDGMDTEDIHIKMSSEQQSGNVVGDVWFQSFGHILYGEFWPNQWLWPYVPPGVEFHWEVTAERPFAIQRRSVDVVGYNSEINPDGCPLTNWWQLTEPELQGKFYMEDPISDSSTTAKITLIVQYADEFATAYQDLYGKDWTTDEAYDADTPNAGYLFLRKLAQNEPGIQPGGDEVDAAFAMLGMDPATEPGYGWTGLSSYEDSMDGELAMAPCYGLEPRVGVLKTGYLGVATNAAHPNAAKLFIQFALSEEGFDPWSAIGTYPPVVGVPTPEGMPALDSWKLWPSDDVFAYANMSQVRDFWAISLLE